MRKTTDAIKILMKDMEHRPGFRKALEEERVNLQAAHAIREARERAGLTQTELARKVGTTQSVISRLEDADYSGHTLKLLERIALACKHYVKLDLEPVGSQSG